MTKVAVIVLASPPPGFRIASLQPRKTRRPTLPAVGCSPLDEPWTNFREPVRAVGKPSTISERELTTALEQAVVRRIGEPRYRLWFDRHTRFSWDDNQLTVGVPNRHFEEWLHKTFHDALTAAAREVFGRALTVRFVIDPRLFQAARREQAEVKAPAEVPDAPRAKLSPFSRDPKGSASPPASRKPAPAIISSPAEEIPTSPKRARRWHRLSEFVVGPCNRVAHASALSVVEAPGEGPNPLVLHGPVGTGKTHLLEGIYAGVRRAHPDWRVCYATTEDFTNRFVQAMRLGKLGAFRKHFRECDALLMDDLHFLAGKKATQEEFLHTFDALLADGRQMVLTCDCHPRLADDFTPELTDRLLGGAVWGLTPPDADVRLAVLRSKAGAGRDAPPDEVLRFLASQLRGNIRELEGALHSVGHYARVAGRPPSVALAREALADLLRHAVRVVRLEDVDKAVRAVLRLESGALQNKGRAWAVSHPRMIAVFLARRHTASSYAEIGGWFGGRNHSTAVAAEKKVRLWMQDDAELALGERRVRVREVVERAERELLR
jgi:chromosomal replication initiator protein